MPTPAPFPRLRPEALLLILAAAVLVRVGTGPITVDDAFITFRYARNIAELGQFAYNPPERVLGTTTPLFALLMAGAAALKLSLPWAALLVAVVADVVTITAVCSLLALAGFAWAALFAGVLIAIWPALVSYSVSGLETSLYVALLTAALWAFSRRRTALLGALLALALYTRPDAVLLIGPAILALFWRDRSAALRALGIIFLIGLPWLLFTFWYFGSPVPQSIVAKSHLTSDRWISVVNYRSYFFHGQYLVLSGLAAVGAVALWRSREPGLRLGLVWWAVYSGVFVATNAFTDFPWYFVPLLPLYFGAAAVGLETLLAWGWKRVRRGAPRAPGEHPALAFGLVLLLLAAGSARLYQHRTTLREWAAGREDLYTRTAEALAARAPHCVLAATEIGALGYHYPGPILDLVGLVSPEAVGRSQEEILRASRPHWLVTYDTHLDRAVATSPWFAAEFRLVSRVPVSESRALEVYEQRADPSCAPGAAAARPGYPSHSARVAL
jgi:MFS family permease